MSRVLLFQCGVLAAAVSCAYAEEPDMARAPFDARQAVAFQSQWARHLDMEVETVNSLGTTMALIPPENVCALL